MADLKFSCPQCRQHIKCDASYAGLQINCPSCQKSIAVPAVPSVVPSGERVIQIQIKVSTLRKTAIGALCLLLAVGLIVWPIYLFVGTRKMTFKASVDGTDVVKLRGNSMWIEHLSWRLPERINVNGKKWVPQWNGDLSARYTLGWGATHRRAANIKLTKLVGRGTITILELPTPANQETLSIQMDDSDFGGADWYQFAVSW